MNPHKDGDQEGDCEVWWTGWLF